MGNRNIYILFMLFIKKIALKKENFESYLLKYIFTIHVIKYFFVNKCLLIYYQKMTFKICYFLQHIFYSISLFTMHVQIFEKESKFKFCLMKQFIIIIISSSFDNCCNVEL